jgi:hypothetical protein
MTPFKKYRVLTQNTMGLAFGPTEKCLFMMKTGRRSVFEPRDAHIPPRLDVSVSYIYFFGF